MAISVDRWRRSVLATLGELSLDGDDEAAALARRLARRWSLEIWGAHVAAPTGQRDLNLTPRPLAAGRSGLEVQG